MQSSYKHLTDFLVELGIETVPHSQKSYLGHLISVYRLMEGEGCTEELCRAGMFHSIYGTEKFQGFKLAVEDRPVVRKLIGDRAEKLGYLNCAMDRASFDEAALGDGETYRFIDRITGEAVELSRADFDDLCRVHLYDWLEQRRARATAGTTAERRIDAWRSGSALRRRTIACSRQSLANAGRPACCETSRTGSAPSPGLGCSPRRIAHFLRP